MAASSRLSICSSLPMLLTCKIVQNCAVLTHKVEITSHRRKAWKLQLYFHFISLSLSIYSLDSELPSQEPAE